MGRFVTMKRPNSEIFFAIFRLVVMFEGPHYTNFL